MATLICEMAGYLQDLQLAGVAAQEVWADVVCTAFAAHVSPVCVSGGHKTAAP